MEQFVNLTWATLAAGMDAVQTTMPLTTGHGARFGTIATGNKIRIVLLDALKNVSEVMYMTGISGDTATVLRGQDGTTATTHLAGDRLEARIGKSSMETMRQPVHIQQGTETLLGSVAGVDNITAAANPTLIAQMPIGSLWKLPAAGANTGAAATLNVDGQGPVSLLRPDGTALQQNDIPAGNYLCLIEKRAADCILLNPAGLLAQRITQLDARHAGNAQTVSVTMATNAVTIAALNSVPLTFRSATATDGSTAQVSTQSANLVIPSGATLGTINGVQSTIVIAEMNNAGTREYAVCNLAGGLELDEQNLISTTAISTSASAANVWYSTTARTSLPYRIVATFTSTQATAGTWATAASAVQSIFGGSLSNLGSIGVGQTWQQFTVGSARVLGTTYYNTTGKPIAISFQSSGGVAAGATLTISGYAIAIGGGDTTNGGANSSLFGIIPPGASYSVSSTRSTNNWFELR